MKPIKKVYITERDISLFKYLFINKVATIKDIHTDIFGQISSEAVYRRLKKLYRKGFLEAQTLKDMTVYNLSKKGFKNHLKDLEDLDCIQLKSEVPTHDLDLLSIKRHLKKFSQVEKFYSENLIRSGYLDDIKKVKRLKELYSDGILKVNLNSKIFYLPIEYESSSKSPKRNLSLVRKYYLSPYVPVVLFISKTPQIESKIRSKENEESSQDQGQFYYIQRKNLLHSKKECLFKNIKNEYLTLTQGC